VASVKNWHPSTVRFSVISAIIWIVLAVTNWLTWASDRAVGHLLAALGSTALTAFYVVQVVQRRRLSHH